MKTALAPPPPLTAEEFTEKYADGHYELVDGYPEETAMPGGRHGQICSRVSKIIGRFIDDHQPGVEATNDTFIVVKRNPDRVRGADYAYWKSGRVPNDILPIGSVEIPPDLVVEIRSPDDRPGLLLTRVGDFLSAGVPAVVVLDPQLFSAAVYSAGDDFPQRRHNGDELTLPDVLPGFAVPVKAFFT